MFFNFHSIPLFQRAPQVSTFVVRTGLYGVVCASHEGGLGPIRRSTRYYRVSKAPRHPAFGPFIQPLGWELPPILRGGAGHHRGGITPGHCKYSSVSLVISLPSGTRLSCASPRPHLRFELAGTVGEPMVDTSLRSTRVRKSSDCEGVGHPSNMFL